MLIQILTYALVVSYVVFLILGIAIRARWRDRIASSLPEVVDPVNVGGTILVVKPSGQLVEQGWFSIAGLFAGGILVLTMMAEEPGSEAVALGWSAGTGALIALPWIGLILALGYYYTLTEDGITRCKPFSQDRSILWRNVRSLRYDEIVRGGFVLSDGVNSFTVDVMRKNGKSFLEYARSKVPAEAWAESAVQEAEARLHSSKGAGPHMVRSAKRERL